jgi:hypothetical protein
VESSIKHAGVVKDTLTNSPTHLYGIQVLLESGEAGCVKVSQGESRDSLYWSTTLWTCHPCALDPVAHASLAWLPPLFDGITLVAQRTKEKGG